MPNIKAKLELQPTNKILKDFKIDDGGEGQKFLLSEVRRLSDPYTPMDTGTTKNLVGIAPKKKALVYHSIQSRYLWFGKVMVGRPPKRVTNKNLKYAGAPRRGPFWVNRMWTDRGGEILKALAAYTGGKVK
ncbi:minor capsid protein [Eubacterium sp.]|uniref:minor capsid protein n=1 Tax=Eubacterium sp. TaxID=142586 RepID=UPI0026E06E86|nr:minor capsid protein [Eubacterium sp.]MDO5432970.1 minor capsid protein [Eubacterium sp.]